MLTKVSSGRPFCINGHSEEATLLDNAVDHLTHNVLDAAADYETAEQQLTRAYNADQTLDAWQTEARKAKCRAAELAIAIDGLADRCVAFRYRSGRILERPG